MALLHTSLHGSYMPVTLFYLSTNLVDNFFHNLWQCNIKVIQCLACMFVELSLTPNCSKSGTGVVTLSTFYNFVPAWYKNSI